MNETWASEVERRLRAISDKLAGMNQGDLLVQGPANWGFMVKGPPTSGDDEIVWIRLIEKAVISGVNTYSWRRQVYVMTGAGMAWLDSGESGTLFENPAVALNNEDLSVTDGKRYPAKYNPDTGQWIFFLRRQRLTGPDWPVSLWGFHGIIEFGYFDVWDERLGGLTVNPAVANKWNIENIQAFRVKDYASGGNPARFRGASGWYFQASASTSEVRINTLVQDERDVGTHGGWGNVVQAWEDGDLGSFDTLLMGLPTFGGYYYGTVDEFAPFDHEAGPGPIRMSYLYGETFTTLNNRLQFAWQGGTSAKLVGTTPAIPNWAALGSLVPDSPSSVIDAQPASDTIIPLDGLRGIRIRVLGWHAHMADHACKPFDTFNFGTFPAGMNFVWRENAAPFAYDDGVPIGQYTQQSSIDPVTSEIIYNDKIEFTGFHHYYFAQWSDTTLGGPARYQIDLKTKVWYKSEDDPAEFRPDPFRVLVGGERHEPDEVIHTDATQRQTVHIPPDPIFNVEASYANNVGFVVDFSQTVNNIAWIHQEWRQNDRLIGAQFWGGRTPPADGTFGVTENSHNAIAFQKINPLDRICDNMEAALICSTFGNVERTPLPKAYVAAKTLRESGPHTLRVNRVWDFPAGTTYDVRFSDNVTLTDVDPEEFEKSIALPFWAEVTAYPPAQTSVSHRTYFGLGLPANEAMEVAMAPSILSALTTSFANPVGIAVPFTASIQTGATLSAISLKAPFPAPASATIGTLCQIAPAILPFPQPAMTSVTGTGQALRIDQAKPNPGTIAANSSSAATLLAVPSPVASVVSIATLCDPVAVARPATQTATISAASSVSLDSTLLALPNTTVTTAGSFGASVAVRVPSPLPTSTLASSQSSAFAVARPSGATSTLASSAASAYALALPSPLPSVVTLAASGQATRVARAATTTASTQITSSSQAIALAAPVPTKAATITGTLCEAVALARPMPQTTVTAVSSLAYLDSTLLALPVTTGTTATTTAQQVATVRLPLPTPATTTVSSQSFAASVRLPAPIATTVTVSTQGAAAGVRLATPAIATTSVVSSATSRGIAIAPPVSTATTLATQSSAISVKLAAAQGVTTSSSASSAIVVRPAVPQPAAAQIASQSGAVSVGTPSPVPASTSLAAILEAAFVRQPQPVAKPSTVATTGTGVSVRLPLPLTTVSSATSQGAASTVALPSATTTTTTISSQASGLSLRIATPTTTATTANTAASAISLQIASPVTTTTAISTQASGLSLRTAAPIATTTTASSLASAVALHVASPSIASTSASSQASGISVRTASPATTLATVTSQSIASAVVLPFGVTATNASSQSLAAAVQLPSPLTTSSTVASQSSAIPLKIASPATTATAVNAQATALSLQSASPATTATSASSQASAISLRTAAPLVTLTSASSQATGISVRPANPLTTTTTVSSQALAVFVGQPSALATTTASSQAGASAVRLPAPVATITAINSQAAAVSSLAALPTTTATVVSSQSAAFPVRLPSAVTTTTTASSQASGIAVRRPSPATTTTTVTTQLEIRTVRQTQPSTTMNGATTTLTLVTVRPASAPITESNPRVTVTTSLTAEAVPDNPYEEFCDLLANNGGYWNQLDGLLAVKINGTTVTANDAGDFTGGVTVSFEFVSSLQQFLDDNPDVTISYAWESVCSGVPKRPETGSGTVAHNGSVSVPFTDNCGGDHREVNFTITMTTPTLRALFNDTCSPWGTNQGISSRSVYFNFDMFP